MRTGRAALLLTLIGLVSSYAHGQAAAEAGVLSTNSGMSIIGSQTNSDLKSATEDFGGSIFDEPSRHSSAGSPQPSSKGGALIAPSGPPPDEVNRKKFELLAGKDAGRVLFRSIPNGANIFVNHLIVGRTPLLLFLAPGKYEVDMRAPRQETGTRDVGVMPKETQTVEIDLNQRYPSSVSIRW